MIWLRRLLGALALALAVASGWQAVALWRGGGWWVERAEDTLQQVYTTAIARAATPARVAELLDMRLSETPRNWHVIDALLAESAVLPPDLQTRVDAARDEDFSLWSYTTACSRCAYDLSQCTLGPDLACGLGINLTFAGDLLVLGREGLALGQGADVDGLDVTLAFIGLGATALVVATGGTSYTVKAGAGLMRVAHRMGRLAPDLRRVYTRAFRNGVDWGALAKGAPLARATRAEALGPALRLTDDLGVMRARAGTRGTLHLLGAADTLPEARALARTARAIGPRSTAALEVLGKSRLIRLGLRLSDEVLALLASAGAALSALGGLVAGRVLRLLRRMI
ncbi:hypothetical protein ROE7235_01857 [Roseibaca ekhonensis]|uniref:Uncharacterized protein n=1 Tax=Roseinatronobacter ekhonensis TaxID=254356 RepID=A0A3B0MTE0_9RHOB|nr:hypothetical protein [Roseibaca ekhonensis]SUZ32104.1 hypothetical protein ROE7235_01857 [Roseibaca ekhonensis]